MLFAHLDSLMTYICQQSTGRVLCPYCPGDRAGRGGGAELKVTQDQMQEAVFPPTDLLVSSEE